MYARKKERRMDFEKDYILRLIQMLGDLMRRVASLLDDRERNRMLDGACREWCGMALEAGEKLAPEALCDLLAPEPRLVMAELLAGKADALTLSADTAEDVRLRAVRLMASLYAEGNICQARAGRLAALKTQTLEALTAPDLMNCARFFAQGERFDEMEDALFQALEKENGEQRENMRAEAVAMLRRAAKAGEHTLAYCNMTGQELRESARELEAEAAKPTYEQERPD